MPNIDYNPNAPKPREYSAYQTAIFDAISNTRANIVVSAVAGSGKTTTIVEASKRIPSDASSIFCAFNKSIVEELGEHLGGNTTCKTINAIGHGAVSKAFGRVKLDDGKYRDLIAEATEFVEADDIRAFQSGIAQLVSFAQSTLADTTDDGLTELVAQYGIELATTEKYPVEYFFDAARHVLERGRRVAEEERVISFNDQIWLPNLLNLPCTQYDFVFVDEVQDLSRAKLGLVLKSTARNGRIVAVGDPRQSIYGFAGADPKAWQEIIAKTDATVLPLSVSYRCPRAVIELAQEIVPEIEAAPNAIEGVVEEISHDTTLNDVVPGDLILCRFTAPLIRTCLDLIGKQKPARVAGRDIAKQLVGMAKDALKLGTWEEFPAALAAHVALKKAQLKGRKNVDALIHSIEDRADGVLACYDAFEARTIWEFASKVESIFGDGSNCIELATIHRTKGLEANRIFILEPQKLGTLGKLAWEREQEMNLKYVAQTRAKTHLYFVGKRTKKA